MRPERVEKEMKEYIPNGADSSEYIPVHDGETVIGVILREDIDYLPDASYGGAWIGQEREIGFVRDLKVVTDGDYEYAY